MWLVSAVDEGRGRRRGPVGGRGLPPRTLSREGTVSPLPGLPGLFVTLALPPFQVHKSHLLVPLHPLHLTVYGIAQAISLAHRECVLAQV